MKRITNVKRSKTRRYDSALRAQQSSDTRDRILDALIRTMGKGIAELSIPAVAREAGVSVPTVYRHFRTKADLIAALAPRFVERTGLMDAPAGARLGALARVMYDKHEGLGDATRVALASELGSEVRHRMMPERKAIIRRTLRAQFPVLRPQELDRLTRFTLIVFSSATIRAFEDYLGMSPAEAGKDVAWALEALDRGLHGKR
jgi:AcrR family transcriptional regulator